MQVKNATICCACHFFAVNLQRFYSTFAKIFANTNQPTRMSDKEHIKSNLRKWLTNKYLIAILVFAIVYVFVGNQSLIKRIQRSRQIRTTEEQLRAARADTEHALRMMETLQDTDSLEKFAREQYGMHTDREEVYLVDDK